MDTTVTSAPAAAPRIPLAAIALSPTNPRKRFDEHKLQELAESIRRHDVLQPILLRPRPDEAPELGKDYQLVAGERRFRAAMAAGLADIPATVRTLSDAEVLEIQVVENLQREDIHELEEAEGYEQLLKCKHANGERYTVDEIAAKVGKSRSYVFGRLKLTALCPEARKAFYAGELDASRALLIARIGHHDTQRQALKEIGEGQFRGAMSYREAHQYIINNFMLKLSGAPFDIKDEELVAKAGACGPCPKRTGNQADLFGDVKSGDVCTDPKCFDTKRQAHYVVAARALEAQGFKVIAGDAAKKVLLSWENRRGGEHYLHLVGGYEQFGSTTYASGRSRPVKSLFPDDYKPTKLQHPLTGEIFDVVTQQAIAAAVKKLPEPKKGKAKSSSAGSSSGPRERKLTEDEIYNRRLLRAIAEKAPAGGIEIEQLRWIATDMQDALDIRELDAVAEAFFPAPADPKEALKHNALDRIAKALMTMNNRDLSRVIFTMLAARGLGGPAWMGSGQRVDVLKIALKRTGVDPAKVKKQIADEAKAAAQKSAKGLGAKGVDQVAKAAKKPAKTPLLKGKAAKK
jgi:ParB/RepB/Spo0J family partition protein